MMRNRSAWDDEEGATVALVALSLMTLLAVALVAIDGGSMLHTRRGLVADTDAAALATAFELLEDPCATEGVARAHAEEMAVLNSIDTAVVDVALDRGGDCTQRYGYVEVSTAHPVALFFAPVFGVDAWDATAASTAGYGRLEALDGLRPIGLCGSETHYQEWAALMTTQRTAPDTDDAAALAAYEALAGSGPEHPAYAGAGVVHRIPFQRLGLGSCALGGPAGNWGWLDFNAQGRSNSDLNDWIDDGYDGTVDLGGPAPGDEDCNDTQSGTEDCSSMPGGRGASTEAALDSITCPAGTVTSDCLVIYVIVYDQIGGSTSTGPSGKPSGKPASGANTEYHPASFAGLVLRGHDLGTGAAFGDTSWIDIEFVDERVSGRIGASLPTDPYPGPLGVELCGTEHFDACP